MIGPHSQFAFGPCFWCGRQTYRTRPNSNAPHMYTRDHLIPKKLRRISLKAATGTLAKYLTVTCCNNCNQKKGGKSAYRFAATVNLSPEKMKVIHRAYSLNRRSDAHI